MRFNLGSCRHGGVETELLTPPSNNPNPTRRWCGGSYRAPCSSSGGGGVSSPGWQLLSEVRAVETAFDQSSAVMQAEKHPPWSKLSCRYTVPQPVTMTGTGESLPGFGSPVVHHFFFRFFVGVAVNKCSRTAFWFYRYYLFVMATEHRRRGSQEAVMLPRRRQTSWKDEEDF